MTKFYWIILITAGSKKYRKTSKDWTTKNNYSNYPKNGTVGFESAVMHPKDADRRANSADPDQTAP